MPRPQAVAALLVLVMASAVTALLEEPVHLLVIVHGLDFVIARTPVFIRTLLAARSSNVVVHVLGNQDGLRGFHDVWQRHAVETGLVHPKDSVRLISEDEVPRVGEYLQTIHTTCHSRGYAYLFLKVLAAELLPDSDKLIIIDPDAIVLGNIVELWAEFDAFGADQVLSMTVDQSDRYYFRLQDSADDAYSPGWHGVPHSVGVNGGMVLLHAARARQLHLAQAVAEITHAGASERVAGQLERFCDLAEQDALNLLLARRPALWRPLHISWNYMATGLGGHVMVPDAEIPLTWYDVCPQGVHGARGTAGDLLRSECGRRVHVLHFVGGVRRNPILAQINGSVLEASGPSLLRLARLRAALPRLHRHARARETAKVATPEHHEQEPDLARSGSRDRVEL